MERDVIRAALRAGDEEERHAAVGNVPLDGTPEALALLCEAMGDESWRVRKEAVSRVAAWPRPGQAAPALVAALGEESNIARRNAAVEALGLIGRPAVDALLAALDSGRDSRKLVIDALGAIGDARAVSPLAAVLEDPDPNVRAAAAEALGHLGRRECAPALQRTLESSDLLTRLAALEALNRLGASVPYRVLKPLLGERVLRRAALEALGFVGEIEALPDMVAALADRSRGAREAAIVALTALHATVPSAAAAAIEASLAAASPEAVRSLCAALGADSRSLRRAAATLLGWAKRPETLRDLCEALRDDSLQDAVAEAIAAFGAAAVGPLCDFIAELDADLRAEVFALVPRLGAAASDPLLCAALARAACDDEPEPAAAAAHSLGTVGQQNAAAQRAIAALFQALRREDAVAAAAASALGAVGVRHYDEVRTLVTAHGLGDALAPYLCCVLGACGRPEDRALLLAALKDENAGLRRAAADALARLGPAPEATEALAFALTDEAATVRAAAARALGSLRAAGAVGALLAVAAGGDGGGGGEEPGVRVAAIRALGAIAEGAALPTLRGLVSVDDGAIATAALEAFGPLADEQDEPLLCTALGHGDAEVVKAAVRALGPRRSVRTRTALAGVLGHPRWDVRRAAVEALAGRDEVEAQTALRERLALEQDELVRQAIVQALGGRG